MTLSNGTTYPDSLPASAVAVLDRARILDAVRVRLVYIEADGETWTCEGYVSRTCGNPSAPGGGVKAAMLLHNRRSMGGDLLDGGPLARIERTAGGAVLWTAPK